MQTRSLQAAGPQRVNSERRVHSTNDALGLLGVAIVAIAVASSLAYFGLGIDLAETPGIGVPCLFRALIGIECPGCGMTRALLLASQTQWIAAWRMNPLLFPLLAICGLGALGSAKQRLSDS